MSQSCRRLGAVTEKNKTILTCPLCSYRTEIQIGGIARVPKNFLLERQLQNKLNSLDVKNSCGKCCNLCYEKIEVSRNSFDIYSLYVLCVTLKNRNDLTQKIKKKKKETSFIYFHFGFW